MKTDAERGNITVGCRFRAMTPEEYRDQSDRLPDHYIQIVEEVVGYPESAAVHIFLKCEAQISARV